MKKALIAIALLLTWMNLSAPFAYGQKFSAEENESYIGDYRTIPGVTQQDIEDIEALKAQYGSFTYGTMLCGEAFQFEDGSKGGFSIELCKMLTQMFGMEFRHQFYEWDALLNALANGEVDFSGELTATPERREIYFMTDAIYERTIKIFRLRNSEGLRAIAERRALRFAVLEGVVTGIQVRDASDLPIEIVYVSDYETAAEWIRTGEVDAFLEESPAVSYFEEYDFLQIEDYFPLVYSPVSMTTAQPEFAPIIRVMQHYLEHGGIHHLAQMYSKGNQTYLQNKLHNTFTEEEREFVRRHSSVGNEVPIAALADNYPISFYNEQEGYFQGIAMDILDEISGYTGIRFAVANDQTMSPAALQQMVEAGTAKAIAGLTANQQNRELYLWGNEPFSENQYALLTTAEHQDIELNQILYSTLGLVEGSPFAQIYMQWFPSSENTRSYATTDEAFAALQRGEIDFLMASQYTLLSQTNYREAPGFKVSLALDHYMHSSFAFHKDQRILRSIIDKAQTFLAVETINERWARKMFDYRSRLLRDLFPILLTFSLTLAIVLVIVLRLHLKNRKLGKNLENLVAQRTAELAEKTATLTTVFSSIPDLIFCKDRGRRFTQCNKSLEQYLGHTQEELLGKTNEQLFPGENDDIFYAQADEEVLRMGIIKVVEEQIYSPYLGESRLFETIKTPLYQNGEVVGVMGIARDITERKAIEAAVKVASQAKSEFLARMSHEIRTDRKSVV